MIEHEIQKTILSNCSFFPEGAKYSQLKSDDLGIENDLFNYHLQQLVKNEFLEKRDNLYYLTTSGKSLVTNIDHVTKQIATNYKVSVYLCPIVDGKVLLYKRLKHPQFGYTGLVSGKIPYGLSILENAKKELKEETDLEAEFKIIGNLRQIRRNKEGDVIEDGVFYVCYTDKVQGNLLERTKEGEYFWIDLNKVSTLQKVFKPSLEIILNEVRDRLENRKPWQDKFIYEFFPEPEDY